MYDISCDYNPTDLTQETRGVMSNIVAIWSLSYDYNPDYPGRRAAGRRVGWRASGCRSSQSRPPRRRGSRRPPTATHWLSPPAHNTPRIKGQCHEIFLKLFFIKKAQSGPNMNRQKRFPKIFVFAKTFSRIHEKMCVHAVVDYITLAILTSMPFPVRTPVLRDSTFIFLACAFSKASWMMTAFTIC